MDKESVVTDCYMHHADAQECDSRCPYCIITGLEAELKLQSDSADNWEEEAIKNMKRAGELQAENAALREAITTHKREIEERMNFKLKSHAPEDRKLWAAVLPSKEISDGYSTGQDRQGNA